MAASITTIDPPKENPTIIANMEFRDSGTLADVIPLAPLEAFENKLKELQELQALAFSPEEFQEYQAAIDATQAEMERFKKGKEDSLDASESLATLGEQFGELNSIIGLSSESMLGMMGNTLQLFSQLITQITALTAVKNAETTATNANTAAKGSEAIASGTAQAAKIKFPLNIIAIGITIASIIKALATKPPKLASGGLAFGRTLAEVGEYSNASANPEVIAPLDKLQAMLPQAQSNTEFIISETKLRGADIYTSYQRQQKKVLKRT